MSGERRSEGFRPMIRKLIFPALSSSLTDSIFVRLVRRG